MSEQLSKLEAVRRAREELGAVDAKAIAAYVETRFGMKMKPAIVTVLLASLRERETLERNRRKARVELERLRTENVEDALPCKTDATGKKLKNSFRIARG